MSLPEVFAEIKSQSRKKGLTLSDIIEDLDKSGVKKLSILRFRRIFNILGIWMDEAKFSAISDPYTTDEIVDCASFLNDYENPGEKFSTAPIVTIDQLREFAGRFAFQNTSLQEILFDYDQFHNGKVSQDAFLSCVGISPVSKGLAKQYAVPPINEVDYISLINDMNNALATPKEEHSITDYKLPSYFSDVAQAMRIKGIDAMQVLSGHDRFKKRKILPVYFITDVKNVFNLSLTPFQIQELCDTFTIDDQFDYVAFCEALDAEEKKSMETTQKAIQIEAEESQEIVVFNDLIKYLQNIVADRHALLDISFEQYDQQKTGKLSTRQFLTILEQEKISLTDGEKRELVKAFQTDETNVCYTDFVSAITPPQKSVVSEVDNLLIRLKEHLIEKHLRLRPIMTRLDPTQKGFISLTQLQSIFRNISFDMSKRELRLFKLKFPGNIEINELCSIVDQPEEPKEETKEEEDETEEIPEKEVLDVLAKVSSIVTANSVDLMNEFKRFESTNLGEYRISTLRNVLISLPQTVSDSDIELLINHYKIGDRLQVNGRKFMQEVDTFGADQLKINPELSLSKSIELEPPSEEVQATIRRLKVVLSSKNIPPLTLFAPYDQTKCGNIAKEMMPTIINYINFQASENELNDLVNAFTDTRMPERFNYKRLCTAIDEAEIQELDRTSIKLTKTISNDGDYAMVSIINTLHEKLTARRRSAKSTFNDLPDDPIPVSDFRERISNYGLIISQADMSKIITKYRANMNGDIDWKQFVEDIDSSRTLQNPQ